MLSVPSCATRVGRCNVFSSNHRFCFFFFLKICSSSCLSQNQVFICKCLKEILASLCLFMLIYLKYFCRISGSSRNPHFLRHYWLPFTHTQKKWNTHQLSNYAAPGILKKQNYSPDFQNSRLTYYLAWGWSGRRSQQTNQYVYSKYTVQINTPNRFDDDMVGNSLFIMLTSCLHTGVLNENRCSIVSCLENFQKLCW